MTEILVESIAGLIAGGAIVFVSAVLGFSRERGVYPTILIAIATFYVVFAIENGDGSSILFNGLIAGAFAFAALYGYVKSLWVVAGALVAHGIFDLIYGQYVSNPAPTWWPVFCTVIDVVFGAAPTYWIVKKRVAISS